MKRNFKVRFFAGNIYEVIEILDQNQEYKISRGITSIEKLPLLVNEVKVFQGTLSDCEAFIRLEEAGYME